MAKLKTRAKAKFRNWLWPAGWEELGICRPDLVLVLAVPPKISRKLNFKKEQRKYLKGKKQDIAEKDGHHQQAAYREYLLMCRREKNWVKIDGCDRKGDLKTPEEIHRQVMRVLKKRGILEGSVVERLVGSIKVKPSLRGIPFEKVRAETQKIVVRKLAMD